VLNIRPFTEDELATLEALPLSRYGQPGGEYLIAWWAGDAVGHAHADWSKDPPELQDVWVREDRRRRGIAAALLDAVERRAAARGHMRLALEVSEGNAAARSLYQRHGFVRSQDPPRRVVGTVQVRTGVIDVDDVLLRYEKELSKAPANELPCYT
jgi:GNAT superfamily N-acetyltransferase